MKIHKILWSLGKENSSEPKSNLEFLNLASLILSKILLFAI